MLGIVRSARRPMPSIAGQPVVCNGLSCAPSATICMADAAALVEGAADRVGVAVRHARGLADQRLHFAHDDGQLLELRLVARVADRGVLRLNRRGLRLAP